MGVVAIPYSFVDATVAEASEANANFDALAAKINGGIDSANISANFSWPASQITLNDTAGDFTAANIEQWTRDASFERNGETLDNPLLDISGTTINQKIALKATTIGFKSSGTYASISNQSASITLDDENAFGILDNTTASIASGVALYLYAVNVSGCMVLAIGRHDEYKQISGSYFSSGASVSASQLLVDGTDDILASDTYTVRNIATIRADYAITSSAYYGAYIEDTYKAYDSPCVAAIYQLSTNQDFAAGAQETINYENKITDTHNAVVVHTASWSFYAPADGLYTIDASVFVSGSNTSGTNHLMYINLNASAIHQAHNYCRASTTPDENVQLQKTIVWPLKKGDRVSISLQLGQAGKTIAPNIPTKISITSLSLKNYPRIW